MTANFGSSYDFIGIKVTFLKNKTFEVDVREYLKDVVKDVHEDGLKPVKISTRFDLFNADESSLLAKEAK